MAAHAEIAAVEAIALQNMQLMPGTCEAGWGCKCSQLNVWMLCCRMRHAGPGRQRNTPLALLAAQLSVRQLAACMTAHMHATLGRGAGVLELSEYLDRLGVPRALVTRNVNCARAGMPAPAAAPRLGRATAAPSSPAPLPSLSLPPNRSLDRVFPQTYLHAATLCARAQPRVCTLQAQPSQPAAHCGAVGRVAGAAGHDWRLGQGRREAVLLCGGA